MPHETTTNLFGVTESQCNCDLCLYSRKVRGIISRRNVDELIATVNELMDANHNVGFDLEVAESVLNGSWPSAVAQLERALEKAKVHPNRKYDNEQ